MTDPAFVTEYVQIDTEVCERNVFLAVSVWRNDSKHVPKYIYVLSALSL